MKTQIMAILMMISCFGHAVTINQASNSACNQRYNQGLMGSTNPERAKSKSNPAPSPQTTVRSKAQGA